LKLLRVCSAPKNCLSASGKCAAKAERSGSEGNLGATLSDYGTSSTFVPNPAYK
jgi:hypothetical protein